MAFVGHRDQGEPQHRGPLRVEVPPVVPLQELLEGPLPLPLRTSRQVHELPRQLDPVEHQLHRITRRTVHERRPQIRIPVKQRLTRHPHPLGIHPATQMEHQLHLVRVEAGTRVRVVLARSGLVVRLCFEHAAVEQQTRLQRRLRPHIHQTRETTLPRLDLRLRHLDQRHIRRRQTTSVRQLHMLHQTRQSLHPQPRQLLHINPVQERAREGEEGGQLLAAVVRGHDGVDVERHHRGHVGRGQRDEFAGLGGRVEAQAPQVLRHVRTGEPAQVVEADLPRGATRQHLGGPRIQIPQQTEPHALVGHAEQLLLDRLHRTARSTTTRERLTHIHPGQVEPHRIHTGEPAHRPRQIRPRNNLLLAPVPLKTHQHRRLGHTPPLTPTCHRQSETGQQYVVHTATERRRHRTQQRLRHIDRNPHPHGLHRRHHIHRRVQSPRPQQRIPALKNPLPQSEFGLTLRPHRLLRQGVGPPAHRRPHPGQLRHFTRTHALPRGSQIRTQDPPRHPVHHQVVRHHQQTARHTRINRLEPHQLHHHTRSRIQASDGRVRERRHALVPEVRVPRPFVRDAVDHRVDVDGARRGDFVDHGAVGLLDDPCAQDVVVVDQGRDRRGQTCPVDAHGQFEGQPLGEPLEAGAEFTDVRRDRQFGQGSDAAAVQLGEHLRHRLRTSLRPHHLRQLRHRTELEHLPRRHLHTHRTRPRHHLDGPDTVPAHREEVVIDTDPLHTQHLGEHPRQGLLDRITRSPVLTTGELRLRQRPTVELPVRGQRQGVEGDERGRHHVLRQPLKGVAAQLRGRRARVEVDVPHPAGGAVGPHRHDVGDELLATRSLALVDHHGSLCHAGVGGDDGLDLARLDAEAADLDLGVGAAHVLKLARAVPACEVARAVHARTGATVRIGDETHRGQARAVVVGARHAVPRHIELPHDAARHGGQAVAEDVHAPVPDRRADGAGAGHRRRLGQRQMGHVHRGLGDAVHVDERRGVRHVRRVPAVEAGRVERLAAEDHQTQGGVGSVLRVVGRGQRVERGGGLVQDGDALVDEEPPQRLRGADDVPRHHDHAPAGRQRAPQLPHGEVEGLRVAHRPHVVAAEAAPLTRSREQRDDVAVRDGDALGGARRPGGVDDVRGVGGAQRPDPVGVRRIVLAGVVRRGEVVEVQVRGLGAGQERSRGLVRDDDTRRAIGEHELETLAGVLGVHRQVSGAGLHDAEQSHDEFRGARQCHRHQVVGADAAADESVRQSVRPCVDLPVGVRGAVEADRDGVRCARGVLLEELGDGRLRDGRGGVVEPRQELLSLGRVQDLDGADAGLRGGGGGPDVAHEPADEFGEVPGLVERCGCVEAHVQVAVLAAVLVGGDHQLVDDAEGAADEVCPAAREVDGLHEGNDVEDRSEGAAVGTVHAGAALDLGDLVPRVPEHGALLGRHAVGDFGETCPERDRDPHRQDVRHQPGGLLLGPETVVDRHREQEVLEIAGVPEEHGGSRGEEGGHGHACGLGGPLPVVGLGTRHGHRVVHHAEGAGDPAPVHRAVPGAVAGPCAGARSRALLPGQPYGVGGVGEVAAPEVRVLGESRGVAVADVLVVDLLRRGELPLGSVGLLPQCRVDLPDALGDERDEPERVGDDVVEDQDQERAGRPQPDDTGPEQRVVLKVEGLPHQVGHTCVRGCLRLGLAADVGEERAPVAEFIAHGLVRPAFLVLVEVDEYGADLAEYGAERGVHE